MLILAAALAAAIHAADRVAESDLAGHIRVLASEEFEGRKPGTAASNKTLSYIATAWARAGLVPGAPGGWYQPVALLDRSPRIATLSLRGRRQVSIPADAIVALGADPAVDLAGHRLVEVGADPKHMPDVAGQIAVSRIVPGAPFSLRGQGEALVKAGAAAVLFLLPDEGTLPAIREGLTAVTTSPAGAKGLRLYAEAKSFDALRARAGGGDLSLSGRVLTNVRPYQSYNVIGRIPGTGATGEAVAIIAHWDHLGICRPEGAPDRICNGAVDNASGIAVMIEVAERLELGPRPARDIVFIATTAEESGLLGAAAYVANPSVPLDKIVALLNIDTIAIGPRGLPVSAVNRGNTAIDPLIDEIARQQGRALDQDLDANAFITRQDGSEFTKAGVPSVMVGGSFADIVKLLAFLGSVYHAPDDEFSDALPLGGAAEDAELHILLTRALADPRRYPAPPRKP